MAAAVMALAMTTSITTMQRAFLGLEAARGTSYASQIMQTEFEKMRLANWATVSAYTGNPTIDSTFNAIPYIVNRQFAMTRTVATVHTGMLQVTLRITWTTFDGRQMARSYTTYYGQNGLYDYVSDTAS